MRRVICALIVVGLASPAVAQDWDILRGALPVGPALFTNWTGVYVGGQWGYNDGSADFSNATKAPIAYALRETALENASEVSQYPVLGTADHTTTDYGGFIGYNSQWQDLILGVEANYTHTTLALDAPSSPIVRSNVSDGQGNAYTIGIIANGTLADLNYGSLRGRAGVVLGNFLPYGFVGAAVGMANVNVTAVVEGVCDTGSTDTCSPFAFSATSGKNSAWLYGATVGGGLDVAVTRNIFLRVEYDYVRFAPISDVVIAISGVQVGAGFKF